MGDFPYIESSKRLTLNKINMQSSSVTELYEWLIDSINQQEIVFLLITFLTLTLNTQKHAGVKQHVLLKNHLIAHAKHILINTHKVTEVRSGTCQS